MAKYTCYFKPKIYCNINQKLAKQFTLHSAEAYSEPLQVSNYGGYLFGGNYFRNVPPQMFDKVPKTLFSFFAIWVFFHEHSRITGVQEWGGGGGGFFFTPHLHMQPLYRHLNISRAVTAEITPLHIASSRTRTGNVQFPSASREPLSYAPVNHKNNQTT